MCCLQWAVCRFSWLLFTSTSLDSRLFWSDLENIMLASTLFYRCYCVKILKFQRPNFWNNKFFELMVEIWRLNWSVSMHFVMDWRKTENDIVFWVRLAAAYSFMLEATCSLMTLPVFEIAWETKHCCYYLANMYVKPPLVMWQKRPEITFTSFYIVYIKPPLFIRAFLLIPIKSFP